MNGQRIARCQNQKRIMDNFQKAELFGHIMWMEYIVDIEQQENDNITYMCIGWTARDISKLRGLGLSPDICT